MQIFVQALKNIYTFDVEPNETIRSIQNRIQDKEGIPPDQQRLIYAGKQLDTNGALKDYNIKPFSQLNLLLSLAQKTPITLRVNFRKISPFVTTQLQVKAQSITYDPKMTINSILSDFDLSYLSPSLSIHVKYGNDQEHVISTNFGCKIADIPYIFEHRTLSIQLCPHKSSVQQQIHLIIALLTKLKECIKEPTNDIEAMINHFLFSAIKTCTSFRDLSLYQNFEDALRKQFKGIDDIFEGQRVQYQQLSIDINRMIVCAKKKAVERMPKYVSQLRSVEMEIMQLEITISDMNIGWKRNKIRIIKELKEQINKKEDELSQTFAIWKLEDVIQWIQFKHQGKMDFVLTSDVINKFKMIHFNGSSLHEINDSFLILAGVHDTATRVLLVKSIADLLDKYGGDKYSKVQNCCICTMNEVNTCLVPCGHMCYCEECGKKSFQHTNQCPICRKTVITMVTTYKAGL